MALARLGVGTAEVNHERLGLDSLAESSPVFDHTQWGRMKKPSPLAEGGPEAVAAPAGRREANGLVGAVQGGVTLEPRWLRRPAAGTVGR